jgi:hypothetical protein
MMGQWRPVTGRERSDRILCDIIEVVTLRMTNLPLAERAKSNLCRYSIMAA